MVGEGGSTGLGGSKTLPIGSSAISCLPNELRCCADTGKAWWSLQQTWHREVLWVAIWVWPRESLGQPSPKAAAVGWAGSREGNGAGRGQVKRGNQPHFHQQGDCTMCWEKVGIAPLPKQVPQPNKVCAQEENYMVSLCGLILWNRKSNFKGEKKYVEKFIKGIVNWCCPVGRSCSALIKIPR